MNSLKDFPIKKELRLAVLTALHNLGGVGKTSEINREVALVLNLPKDVVNIEHPDGIGTLLDYRLRWVRTELKKEGLIISVTRGIWKLNNTLNDGEG